MIPHIPMKIIDLDSQPGMIMIYSLIVIAINEMKGHKRE